MNHFFGRMGLFCIIDLTTFVLDIGHFVDWVSASLWDFQMLDKSYSVHDSVIEFKVLGALLASRACL